MAASRSESEGGVTPVVDLSGAVFKTVHVIPGPARPIDPATIRRLERVRWSDRVRRAILVPPPRKPPTIAKRKALRNERRPEHRAPAAPAGR
jgi:hypothetical protein